MTYPKCPRCGKRSHWAAITAQEIGPARLVKQCGYCGLILDREPNPKPKPEERP